MLQLAMILLVVQSTSVISGLLLRSDGFIIFYCYFNNLVGNNKVAKYDQLTGTHVFPPAASAS